MNKKKDRNLFNKYCSKYNYFPLIIGKKRRIIAIGDLHGDFELTIKLLKLAKIIDNNYNWIGLDTYVIQVGDQLDNCRPVKVKDCTTEHLDNIQNEAEDIKVLKFMTELNIKAKKFNGAVISLYGNHEIMNVNGNMNYVSNNDIKGFKNYKDPKNPEKKFKNALDARKHAFMPGNEYAIFLACTRIPFVIVGSFLFVHAGFIKNYLDKLKITKREDLYELNYILKKWLLGLIDKNYVIDLLNSSDSLFWDRILGSIPPNTNEKDPICQQYLEDVLNFFQVKGMIIGHTPQFFSNQKGINSTCSNKLFRIDIGGSFVFNKFDETFLKENHTNHNRIPQVLEILEDSIINILT